MKNVITKATTIRVTLRRVRSALKKLVLNCSKNQLKGFLKKSKLLSITKDFRFDRL